jgi:hypothetical protein
VISDVLDDPDIAQPGDVLAIASPLAVTSVDATTDLLAVVAHGLATGDGPVRAVNVGGGLPSPLAPLTDYWVVAPDADHLGLATSLDLALGGTKVNLTALVAWQASHSYGTGDQVANAGNSYQCITAGMSAGSGGPTTTAGDITDGTAHWEFLGAGNSTGTGAHTLTSTVLTQRPYLVERRATGTRSMGIYTPATAQLLALGSSSIQPYRGRDLVVGPEGQRGADLKEVYTRFELHSRSADQDPDVVLFRGDRWVVFNAREWDAFDDEYTYALLARQRVP